MNQSLLERILEPEVMDDPDEALAYDAMNHTLINQALVDRLIELGGRGHFLDIGTGPGTIPILICQQQPDAHVTAVDLADAMLAIARNHIEDNGFSNRITLQKGDAKGLPFKDQSFDTVYSNTILHHIPNPEPFLTEAYRVLKPDGVLLIRDLFRPDSLETLNQLVEQHAADDSAMQKKLFADSLHAALTPEELSAAAKAAGLQRAEVAVDTDRHMSLQIARA